ncbi:F0F1 ATP synthase subunit B [Cellulosilyticum sp. I15G10I2]|uniref:F0F1 ATP synthase subunit B n=1 Tax=Cellulosilyticum sp. I15G10I2 TaxID=1892843 RepID=UPI0009F39F24|nr:F0F1 ATP synthase subunit B [Cellulosilyticum sp. I15G10I2]
MNTSFITLLSATEPSKIIGFDMALLWDLGVIWISLFVIIWILYRLLFKPVTEFLDKRKNTIAQTISDAASQKASAIELKADYEAKLKNIKDEANQILKDTRAKALIREEEIIKAAREEAENIKQKALSDIKLEQERVKDDLKKEMIEISTIMASKFVSASIDETKHNALIDEIIKEVGDVQWLS